MKRENTGFYIVFCKDGHICRSYVCSAGMCAEDHVGIRKSYVSVCERWRSGNLFPDWRIISLGDVVIYENASGQEQIGRVVASVGQTIDFPKQGGYTVNEYQPAEEIPFETYQSDNGYVTYPMELSEGEYFILNDFRNITDDSREQGAIRREQIKGELLFLMRHRGF